MVRVARLSLAMLMVFYLVGCGTYNRATDELTGRLGIAENGEHTYNPYNPYFRAVSGDTVLVQSTFCGFFIGCPLILIDYPISLVVDIVSLPYDAGRDIYVRRYNKTHTRYEQMGNFILGFRASYGGGEYLDIYDQHLKQMLTISKGYENTQGYQTIFAYQAALLAKTLTPYPTLLVKDRFGAVFWLQDKQGQLTVKRLTNDIKRYTLLPNHADIKVFYSHQPEHSIRYFCTMLPPCGKGIEPGIPFSDDLDAVFDESSLSILTWGSEPKKQGEVSVQDQQGNWHKFPEQRYVVGLSPDKQQAVFLSNAGKVWRATQNGSSFAFVTLSKQQQRTLMALIINTYIAKVDTVQRNQQEQVLHPYVQWFEQYFQWQRKTEGWQLVEITQSKDTHYSSNQHAL